MHKIINKTTFLLRKLIEKQSEKYIEVTQREGTIVLDNIYWRLKQE